MAIEYYAHTRENPETGLIEYQTVEQHLRGTAELCAEFADKLNAKEYGELVGSLHDYGKCTREFLNRILNWYVPQTTDNQKGWCKYYAANAHSNSTGVR